jgi:hypothetical protein
VKLAYPDAARHDICLESRIVRKLLLRLLPPLLLAYIIGARRSSGGGFREGMLVIAGFLTLAAILALAVRGPSERASPAVANPLQ